MASLNKVILIGNLGRDPETRHLPNGDAVANISIATTETWKDKGGDKQEKTEWHRVTFFGRLAEIASEYLSKGSQIYVEGRIQYREYEKDGVKRYSTDIVASEMKMLGGGKQGGGRDQDDDGDRGSRKREQTNNSRRDDDRGSSNRPAPKKTIDDFDDDIPF